MSKITQENQQKYKNVVCNQRTLRIFITKRNNNNFEQSNKLTNKHRMTV